jgi:hypothetical protein
MEHVTVVQQAGTDDELCGLYYWDRLLDIKFGRIAGTRSRCGEEKGSCSCTTAGRGAATRAAGCQPDTPAEETHGHPAASERTRGRGPLRVKVTQLTFATTHVYQWKVFQAEGWDSVSALGRTQLPTKEENVSDATHGIAIALPLQCNVCIFSICMHNRAVKLLHDSPKQLSIRSRR